MEDAPRHSKELSYCYAKTVLILVVMEDAPRLSEHGCDNNYGQVLILVVMEDAPRLYYTAFKNALERGLNPCCNGRCSPTD